MCKPVLIVGDTSARCEAAEVALIHAGYHCHTVETLEDALSLLQCEECLAVIGLLPLARDEGLAFVDAIRATARGAFTPIALQPADAGQPRRFIDSHAAFVDPLRPPVILALLSNTAPRMGQE